MSLGRDPETGKYKQRSKTFHGDDAGADDALQQLVEMVLPAEEKAAANGTDAIPKGDPHVRGDVRGVPPAGSGLRDLVAVLPLEPGESIVGWSADRCQARDGAVVGFGSGDALTYQLVQLHRVRRRSAGSAGTAVRSVWIPRHIVEQAHPSLGEDSALHVWTV